MKRIWKFLFTLLTALFLTFGFIGCEKQTVKLDGDYVLVTVTDVEEDISLLQYMQTLRENGELDFTIENGMVTSIDGKANAADFSSCWMLYTSDEEMSNEGWGVVEYEGKTYGSAILGAEELVVKEGCVYIWWYRTF